MLKTGFYLWLKNHHSDIFWAPQGIHAHLSHFLDSWEAVGLELL